MPQQLSLEQKRKDPRRPNDERRKYPLSELEDKLKTIARQRLEALEDKELAAFLDGVRISDVERIMVLDEVANFDITPHGEGQTEIDGARILINNARAAVLSERNLQPGVEINNRASQRTEPFAGLHLDEFGLLTVTVHRTTGLADIPSDIVLRAIEGDQAMILSSSKGISLSSVEEPDPTSLRVSPTAPSIYNQLVPQDFQMPIVYESKEALQDALASNE